MACVTCCHPIHGCSSSYRTHAALQVDLYENGTIAIVEAVSPELGNRVQRVRVQLPGTSSELLQKFRERKVRGPVCWQHWQHSCSRQQQCTAAAAQCMATPP